MGATNPLCDFLSLSLSLKKKTDQNQTRTCSKTAMQQLSYQSAEKKRQTQLKMLNVFNGFRFKTEIKP